MPDINDPKRPLPVSLNIKVRTYDIDFAGIVSNIAYLRWIEDLRLLLLETYHPLDVMIKEGDIPIIKTTHIEYKRPIKMFDTVTGYLWMESLDSPNWTARAEIVANGKTAATAAQTGVFISLSTMKPSRAPEALKRKFDEF